MLVRRNFLSAVFVLLFAISAYSAVPVVTSDTHPEGEWSNAPSIKVEVSYSGATNLAYVIDREEGTIPDLAGTESTVVDFDGSEINLGSKLDGVYWFHVKAKSGGTWSDTAHYEIKVDNDGPSRPGNINVETLEDGTVMVSWDASVDDLAGMGHYNVYRSTLRYVSDAGISREFSIRDAVAKLVGSEVKVTSFHDEDVVEGNRYHYKVQPVDAAGNAGATSSVGSVRAPSFCDLNFVINMAKGESALGIEVLSKSEFRKGTLSVTDPSGTTTVLVEDESNVDSVEASYPLTDRVNGDYNVSFTAIDDDFDECAADAIFVYDTVFPEIEILSPPDSESLSDLVSFSFRTVDEGQNASGVKKVSLIAVVNDEEVIVGDAEKRGSEYVFDWNTLNFDNGRFMFIARVFDGAGNTHEDSGVYNVQNTFFVRVSAENAIRAAEAEREKALEFIADLKKKNVGVSLLMAMLGSADSNLSYAKDLYDRGFYFELSSEHAAKARESYSAIQGYVRASSYRNDVYIYNQEQLDLFLQASGIDSSITQESRALIQSLQPSRRLEIFQVTSGSSVFYRANVLISFTNADSNFVSVRIVEIIPKQFTNDANSIVSSHEFEVIQGDPIIAFSHVDLNRGRSASIYYALDVDLTKEQADALVSSNVLNYYVSPPILVSSATDISAVRLSSLLNLNSLIGSLPPIEWNTTNILIVAAGAAVFFFILFLLIVFVVFGGYFFFVKKKGRDNGSVFGRFP